MKFYKLVRDKVPDNWNPAYGTNPRIHTADDEEYKKKLYEKLKEEVEEFQRDDNAKELSDILEVLYAICDLKKISREELEGLRKQIEEKSGAFKKRIILEDSED